MREATCPRVTMRPGLKAEQWTPLQWSPTLEVRAGLQPTALGVWTRPGTPSPGSLMWKTGVRMESRGP